MDTRAPTLPPSASEVPPRMDPPAARRPRRRRRTYTTGRAEYGSAGRDDRRGDGPAPLRAGEQGGVLKTRDAPSGDAWLKQLDRPRVAPAGDRPGWSLACLEPDGAHPCERADVGGLGPAGVATPMGEAWLKQLDRPGVAPAGDRPGA